MLDHRHSESNMEKYSPLSGVGVVTKKHKMQERAKGS